MASGLVKGVLDGLNGTFLCYGQTGTGKTHTMGMLDALDEAAPSGVVPR
jgi:Cdc6-like AAA superfamily ATPase